jgi:hypothetical protein
VVSLFPQRSTYKQVCYCYSYEEISIKWRVCSVVSNNSEIEFYGRGEQPLNKSWEDQSIDWWQWLQGQPKKCNPVVDTTGVDSANSQNYPGVWYLAGTIDPNKYGTQPGPYQRISTVPSDRSIFLPIDVCCLTLAESKNFNNSLKGDGDLVNFVQADVNSINVLDLEIQESSGNKVKLGIKDLQSYRVATPSFTVTFPNENIWGVDSGPTLARADGYYFFLKPLPVGQYTVHFFGSSKTFSTEVTYTLTVK